jgi:hypothetical protein
MRVSAFRRAGAPGDEPAAVLAVTTADEAVDATVGAPEVPSRSSGPEPGGRRSGEVLAAPVSASAFRRLFVDAGPDLAHAGVSAVFGTTAGSRRKPGPTWISLTSSWAHGRLIRRADGSFDSEAHRIPDGVRLCADHGEHVQPHHLDELIAAVSRPTDG